VALDRLRGRHGSGLVWPADVSPLSVYLIDQFGWQAALEILELCSFSSSRWLSWSEPAAWCSVIVVRKCRAEPEYREALAEALGHRSSFCSCSVLYLWLQLSS